VPSEADRDIINKRVIHQSMGIRIMQWEKESATAKVKVEENQLWGMTTIRDVEPGFLLGPIALQPWFPVASKFLSNRFNAERLYRDMPLSRGRGGCKWAFLKKAQHFPLFTVLLQNNMVDKRKCARPRLNLKDLDPQTVV